MRHWCDRIIQYVWAVHFTQFIGKRKVNNDFHNKWSMITRSKMFCLVPFTVSHLHRCRYSMKSLGFYLSELDMLSYSGRICIAYLYCHFSSSRADHISAQCKGHYISEIISDIQQRTQFLYEIYCVWPNVDTWLSHLNVLVEYPIPDFICFYHYINLQSSW